MHIPSQHDMHMESEPKIYICTDLYTYFSVEFLLSFSSSIHGGLSHPVLLPWFINFPLIFGIVAYLVAHPNLKPTISAPYLEIILFQEVNSALENLPCKTHSQILLPDIFPLDHIFSWDGPFKQCG